MTQNQRMQLHAEFMKAALSAVAGVAWDHKSTIPDCTMPEIISVCAKRIADAALIEYEKRWQEEEKV